MHLVLVGQNFKFRWLLSQRCDIFYWYLSLWIGNVQSFVNNLEIKSFKNRFQNGSVGCWHQKLLMKIQISWFLKPLCHFHMTDIKKVLYTVDILWMKMNIVLKLLISTAWKSTTVILFCYCQIFPRNKLFTKCTNFIT